MNRQTRNINTRRSNRDRSCGDKSHKLREQNVEWPPRPKKFANLLTPIEAAQYLRLDETGHTPKSALRTLNFWRHNSRQLRGTKFARRVWFLKEELEKFLQNKTEI